MFLNISLGITWGFTMDLPYGFTMVKPMGLPSQAAASQLLNLPAQLAPALLAPKQGPALG